YRQASDARALLEVVFIAAAVAILLALFGQAYRLQAGLALALLGQVGLATWLWRPFERAGMSLENLAISAFFFGLLSLGLRWMLNVHRHSRYWLRVGTVLADFVLPFALVAGMAGLLLHYPWLTRQFLRLLIPGVAAALLVSVSPPSRAARGPSPANGPKPFGMHSSEGFGPQAEPPLPLAEPRGTSWWSVVAGLATTLAFIAAVSWAGQSIMRAFERARQAANQAAMASFPKARGDLPYPKGFFQKGVNFTAEFPDVYASEGARRMLELLPRFGVNAIALVPYGWSSTHPPRVLLQRQAQGWESDEGIEELTRVAHALGMKVLLKPAVWQAIDLDIPSATDRALWFEQYKSFLEHYAQLAATIHADVFCVGGELVHLTAYDPEWRKLIARVRQLYPGPLVYAANFGEEFDHIAFWDALDYIGLQEYYPLPDDLAVESVLKQVEAVQQRYHRPVIFTEAGFPSLEGANRQPWDDALKTRISLQAQTACYQAVFRAFYNQPWFEGMYWWKIETNGSGGAQDRSHTPWGKPAMEVIKQWYSEGGR
ncbi:MAG TPA: hypothetical protein VL523_12395, partial [Terriglobia bacterium]|nr:hypothetical protein [Terriglobia bacterium]